MERVSIRSFSAIVVMGAFLAAILLTGCPEPPVVEEEVFRTEDTDVMTVFLYDALTGDPLASTEVTDTATVIEVTSGGETVMLTAVESANGIVAATDTDTNIKLYNFVANEMIKLVFITPNYHKFESYVTPGATNRFPVYAAYLIPTSIAATSPAHTITLISDEDGSALADGSYVITAGAAALSVVEPAPTAASTTAPQVLAPYLGPNIGGDGVNGRLEPITGTISATGTVEIAAGTLYPGTVYTITVYGATGYQTQTLAAAFTAGVTDTTTLVLGVSELAEPGLQLVAVGHIDATGTPIVNTGRVLTYVFNYDIEISYPLLTAGVLDLSSLVTLNTANSDVDADTTTLGDTVDSTDGALPGGIAIAATANVLTITMSATDVDLTTDAADVAGTLDTDDSLSWDLQTVTGGILVRRSGTSEAWTGLTAVNNPVAGHTFAGDTVIVVRW